MSNPFKSCPHNKQATHNERFHNSTCEHFPDDFYDWKITILFYVSIHYVKALANQLNINIGNDHFQIRNNIKPPDKTERRPLMSFNTSAYKYYDYLYRTSQISRYNGFVDKTGIFSNNEEFQAIMKEDHQKAVESLEKLKLYIKGRGLKIE